MADQPDLTRPTPDPTRPTPAPTEPPRSGTSSDDTSAATTPAALEAEIERKRQDLAHTLDQLGTRLDVKSQVRDRVEPKHLAVAGGVVLALVCLVVWRRRR